MNTHIKNYKVGSLMNLAYQSTGKAETNGVSN
ncbi:MAG: hypothetical protein ACJASL_004423 [Paraglaciecola sp.]|jgi:hypothetical protein